MCSLALRLDEGMWGISLAQAHVDVEGERARLEAGQERLDAGTCAGT